ncbi:SDR family oxidoreductase [Cohnella endophytica]|uniref:SDR family oxidoreductase n=1 Tax=Cohnella endophytica TaxID=2419778 RepID=A0A494XYL6_9BACL|nr:SDR family oxidoreductase [Cohnella endophytica]RKP55049.1 SDR family oxidoreductase [Cohnella endophytica]
METRRKALVTGGSRGIGQGIAFELAKAGYDVTIGHWNDDEAANETARKVRENWGGDCWIVPGDLTKAETVVNTMEATLRKMGRIDLMVNNAGISRFRDIRELPVEEVDMLVSLNFRAPLMFMKEASNHMIEAGIRGSILNITSSRAERAYAGDALYGGLKAGLKRASESAALDLAPYGIRVNCIAPGAIEVRGRSITDEFGRRIPLGRKGLPEDIGPIAVWLASDAASYVTGINLRVDGGLILPGMPEYAWNPQNNKRTEKERAE